MGSLRCGVASPGTPALPIRWSATGVSSAFGGPVVPSRAWACGARRFARRYRHAKPSTLFRWRCCPPATRSIPCLVQQPVRGVAIVGPQGFYTECSARALAQAISIVPYRLSVLSNLDTHVSAAARPAGRPCIRFFCLTSLHRQREAYLRQHAPRPSVAQYTLECCA